MDARGASLLAARIRAGVRIGTRIEVVSVTGAGSDIVAGDCGVVREIGEDGHVMVSWDRGFARAIDPGVTSYRALAVG